MQVGKTVIADKYFQQAYDSSEAMSWHDARSFFTAENLQKWQAKINKDLSNSSVEDLYFAVASGYMSDPTKLSQILGAARKLILNPHNDLDRAIPKPILGVLAQNNELENLIKTKLDNSGNRQMRYTRQDLAMLSSQDGHFKKGLMDSYQQQIKIDKSLVS